MKYQMAATLAALLSCAPLAALAQQQQAAPPPRQAQPAQPAQPGSGEPPLITVGRVGETRYGWTNGRAWFTLDDTSKAALVLGIEQGLILSVRENWDAMPKDAQPTLTDTAGRLTVNGVAFNQMVEQINEFYLDATNLDIPVVDVYEYVVMQAKKTPQADLDRFLENLRKTYHLAENPPKSPKKP
jgi:hypothetical protein